MTLAYRLDKIRQEVSRHVGECAQNLASAIDVELLMEIHRIMDGRKAVGIDGIGKEDYSEGISEKLEDLVSRMKREAYKPKVSRRVFIDKPGTNKKRPLGISCYEDKLVEKAVAQLLEVVYEPKFLDFSYGFRPKRNCHQAIKKVYNEIQQKKVSYVVEADIRSFFDTLDHEWMIKFLENDIADKKFIDIIKKQLKAGILEEGKLQEREEGTVQGGCASAILANIYLHYVLDLWFDWLVRNGHFRGEAYLTRYADDFVVCFQYLSDAERFYHSLDKRLGKFGLEIAPEKTRILEFGRFATDRRNRRGEGKPETFSFLGFTFYCSTDHTKQRFRVKVKSDRKKLGSKLKKVWQWIKENRHRMRIDEMIEKLNISLRGYYNYYAVTDNMKSLWTFRYNVRRYLFYWLNRRSQKKSFTFEEYAIMLDKIPIIEPSLRHVLYITAC